MIAGGWDESKKYIDTSYILEVYFDDTFITEIRYKNLTNVPNSFIGAALGSFKGRSLIMGGLGSNGNCLEFDQEEFQAIPSPHLSGAYLRFASSK